jgi:hypothetical protein
MRFLFLAALTMAASPAFARGTNCTRNPSRCDSDADGLNNAVEANLGTNPLDADTDDDGLNDGTEVSGGTNPLLADTDGDSLDDGDELANGTDPLLADTDGDGVDDDLDLFPLDANEDSDIDCDGIGDNADLDDDNNGAEDSLEVIGGAGLFDEPVFPLLLDVVMCPWSLQGDTYCGAFQAELDGTGGVWIPSEGVVGEWDESLHSNGPWNFLMGFPDLATTSIRVNAVRVVPTSGRICYEGWVESAGGGYNASTGESWLYYYPTGEFSGCVQ